MIEAIQNLHSAEYERLWMLAVWACGDNDRLSSSLKFDRYRMEQSKLTMRAWARSIWNEIKDIPDTDNLSGRSKAF